MPGELPDSVGGGTDIGDDMAVDTISEVLSQTFVNQHKRLEQTAERFNDGSAFVAQESKQMFLLQKMLLGATAQNLLEKEGLADSLLQLKSAGTFPPDTLTGSAVATTPKP